MRRQNNSQTLGNLSIQNIPQLRQFKSKNKASEPKVINHLENNNIHMKVNRIKPKSISSLPDMQHDELREKDVNMS